MRPTQDMLEAALHTITNRKIYGTKGHTVGQMLAEEFIAMIHVAPNPPDDEADKEPTCK